MSQQNREQWGTRTGFLLAAIGSAIGLGNIWRFPYVAYDNGGGAFLIPYLVALLTAGIPMLILEYAIGHRFRASPPAAFRRLSRPAEALGWWQVGICFVISVYYAVIVAWAIRYAGFSITQAWGEDTEAFLFGDFLQVAEAPGAIGGYNAGVAVPLIAVWAVVLVVLALGVRRGIEWANRIFIPLLTVLFLILVVQSLFLDGALAGLNAFFEPDWSAITDGSVWVAAYGQIFFSLSVGFGIMITYASYLRRKSDLTGSALVAGFANSSFELLAGIGVFATLGFMAAAAGVPISEVATDGLGLAFVAFPQIINNIPFAPGLFGLLFFVSLVIAGLTSLVSIVEVVISSVRDRTGLGRMPAVLIVGGLIAVVSIVVFPTDQGLYLLDAADHFINQYGIALAGLVIVVVVAWALRRLPMLRQHAESTSTVPLRVWWAIALGVITPVVLGWMMWDSLQAEFAQNYEDYPTWFLNSAGWGVAIGVIVIAVLVSLIPWKRRAGDADDSNVTVAAVDDSGKGQ
ncbi:sodium-dependent transporter [Streptomonospora sp. PA3]|uniref:sodium-dependent transporter n=1 Tax=Streptomonospora sp. PA3 TaxID=2607326 RepID=UPI0012DC28ED|nr:sodium-dependent transporter [Streptomonospora sp. PA3]MUL41185.1 sodium-dependent transporter [Streptomonospora sp. PA3]